MTKFDIATSMNGIMKSASYQAVFAKPQPQFNKTAAKKKDEKDEECCPPKGKKGKKPEEKEEKGKGKGKEKKPEEKGKKGKKASNYEACVMGLAKISEILDKAGLEKEATFALLALDGLVKSAQTVDASGTINFPEATITPEAPGAARMAPAAEVPNFDEWFGGISPSVTENPWASVPSPDADEMAKYFADDGEGDCDMASDKKKEDKEEEDEDKEEKKDDKKDKDEDKEEKEEKDEDKDDLSLPVASASLMSLVSELGGLKVEAADKKLTSLQKLAAELGETHDFLAVKAAGKKGKTDPKAKVRNKPAAIFGDKHPKVKDKKDHFPIDTIGRARNALAQAQKFDSAPSWWSGSLKELQSAVKKAVKGKYPSIEVGGDKGKKKA